MSTTTPDQNSPHYATLIRLQLAMSALQDLLAATDEAYADDDGQDARIAEARNAAVAAIHIALGAKIAPPARLTRNWTNLNMVRDATRLVGE